MSFSLSGENGVEHSWEAVLSVDYDKRQEVKPYRNVYHSEDFVDSVHAPL